MSSENLLLLLADLVLLTHVAVVLFVVGGLVLIVAGNLRGWQWVNSIWLRLAHLAAIGYVAAQAWFGVTCPLTVLEMWLRVQGGGRAYEGGFVQYWLQRVLYFDAPPWVFTVVYTLFGLLVVAAWLRFPPRFGLRARQTAKLPYANLCRLLSTTHY